MIRMPLAADVAARQLLLSFPESPALVPFSAACSFIGISRQTGDHWLAANKFPVPTVRVGTRKLCVLLACLQVWLEAELQGVGFCGSDAVVPPLLVPSVPVKRGRGRPANVARRTAS